MSNSMNLTKVELLWTYVCPRKCKGCSMNTGEKNSRSTEDWMKGIDKFVQNGASFMAIYGAEPLADFDKLPDVIDYAETSDLRVSIITSIDDYSEKLKVLYERNLRSLTTSFYLDKSIDIHTKKKNDQAFAMLEYFRSLDTKKQIRDLAVIVTMTKDNIDYLPDFVKVCTKKRIWVFLDFFHFRRHTIGTKCSGKYDMDLHVISPFAGTPGWEHYIKILRKLADLNEERGFFVNMNHAVVDIMENHHLVADWRCDQNKLFPSWITVDPHGIVHPCDDFKIGKSDMLDLPLDPKTYFEWRKYLHHYCRGCMWSTHMQSHLIKNGTLAKDTFIKG